MLNEIMKRAGEHKKATALTIAIGSASPTLTGCSTTGTFSENISKTFDNAVEFVKENDKAFGLGAICGAAGAVIDKKKRLRGAAIGATVCAAGGAYWDKLERDLNENLANANVEVIRTETGIELEMKSDITFNKSSDAINSDFYSTLNALAKVLDKYDETKIDISGFTDRSGSEKFNQALSEKRAQSVEEYLSAQGVDKARIKSYGYGESEADQSFNNPQDRKVEIDIYTMPE